MYTPAAAGCLRADRTQGDRRVRGQRRTDLAGRDVGPIVLLGVERRRGRDVGAAALLGRGPRPAEEGIAALDVTVGGEQGHADDHRRHEYADDDPDAARPPFGRQLLLERLALRRASSFRSAFVGRRP